MMNIDTPINRCKVYRFLADAFLYPADNWLESLPDLQAVLVSLHLDRLWPSLSQLGPSSGGLAALQADHRRVFGLTGSLCYETEIGLPHEFRQSQELADLAGFYRAFGFQIGGQVRERQDHLAVELEFMHLLALKEAYASEAGLLERVEVCQAAQGNFLQEHLGSWIELFYQALQAIDGDGIYTNLARFAAAFIQADAERLGLTLQTRPLAAVRPTPPPQDVTCESCPLEANP